MALQKQTSFAQSAMAHFKGRRARDHQPQQEQRRLPSSGASRGPARLHASGRGEGVIHRWDHSLPDGRPRPSIFVWPRRLPSTSSSDMACCHPLRPACGSALDAPHGRSNGWPAFASQRPATFWTKGHSAYVHTSSTALRLIMYNISLAGWTEGGRAEGLRG